jgi:hypothetical protein
VHELADINCHNKVPTANNSLSAEQELQEKQLLPAKHFPQIFVKK